MSEQSSGKAMLHEKDNADRKLTFGLNPTQVAFSRNVKFNRNPAPNSHTDPPAQFVGTEATALTLQILLDAMGTESGSIQSQIDQLVAWTTVPSDQGTSASPPLLVFNWGSLKISNDSAFVGYLEQLKVTIEMFARDGTPLRATVSLALKSDAAVPAATNPTSGAEKSRKRRVLQRGQTLQSLAYDEFGDAGAWRAVAELNGIDDPTRLRPGLEILLPDRRELAGSLPMARR
jgi:Contractile injection system tube protein